MADFANIPAVILAGGRGTRLRSVVADRPKPLAKVCGRPYTTFLLDQLADVGCQKVIISTGYKAEMFEETLGSEYRSLSLLYAQEESALGTGGGVRFAMDYFNEELFLAMNGDSYCTSDLQSYYHWFFSSPKNAALMLTKVEDSSRFGRVSLGKNDEIRSFVEKTDASGPGLINAGVYLLRRELFEAMAVGEPCSIERDIFPKLIGKGLHGYEGEGEFIDIGTPESYAAAEDFFHKLTGN